MKWFLGVALFLGCLPLHAELLELEQSSAELISVTEGGTVTVHCERLVERPSVQPVSSQQWWWSEELYQEIKKRLLSEVEVAGGSSPVSRLNYVHKRGSKHPLILVDKEKEEIVDRE